MCGLTFLSLPLQHDAFLLRVSQILVRWVDTKEERRTKV